ncbi:ABC transporter permease [Dinghuibacter silviterrae]|uniref:FtsX-like permease family protein n=1 Tax=Dinghuibacter silviterrae TaxID=1539049 RepID=A0A4R8DGV1_9BACT|nr:ABC transporter permease [Dinghuibacter silviterrae]TDW96909.1 FtsX-like permease family protein [Dinghuibacter silviterrae]
MFRNYFTIAIRNLQKHRSQSIINIAGLAAGMAISLLIGLWIADEFSFDHYHSNHRRIVQVMVHHEVTGAMRQRAIAAGYTQMAGYTISTALGPALAKGYDDVFQKTGMISDDGSSLLNVGDKAIAVNGQWAQYTIPEIFTFHILAGSGSALKDPSTMLISQSTATALFGHADPIGKIIRRNNNSTFFVGGVYEDLPENSTFYQMGILLPWENTEAAWLNRNADWSDHSAHLYGLLAGNTTPEQATARIKELPTHGAYIAWPRNPEVKETLMTYPLDRIHLHGDFKWGIPDGGRVQFVWFFGMIGTFVLLLACINFMNLSTARSEQRAKEVGIRKTIGSLRSQLIAQFLGESILLALLAFVLAAGLAYFSLPFFNGIAAKHLQFPADSLAFWAVALGFTLLTGILAGSYPAFYLSAFRPVRVLKGLFRAGRAAALPRQVLVTLQFTVSLSLIIGTIIVFRQIQVAKDRPVGYTREGLITVPINTDTLQHRADAVRNELLATGMVAGVAESSLPTTSFGNGNSLEWEGQTEDQKYLNFHNVSITPEFGRTVGWTVLQGRDLSRDFATDTSAMLINMAALKYAGFKNPIGQRVKFYGKPYTIVGVVNDMLANSPYEPIEPAIFLGDGWMGDFTIRLQPGKPVHAALAAIEAVFKKFNPASPFIYHFNDEVYAQKFATETRIGDLAAVFAGLAIFISCLGLFGLASFVAEQRTKEIGVRKVLGAGVLTLWALLSKDFLRLVILSMFISMPLVFIGMHRWLQHYAYRAPLSWWIFASAGAGILLITLATVSFQSLRAALMNPVRSLRTE